MTIGERMKERRVELGLSQEELAKKAGYKSRSSIQKLESSRNLPLVKVEKMAKALNCSPAYIMGWEDDAPTDNDVLEHIELIDLYEQLTRSQKDHIIATMKLLIKE